MIANRTTSFRRVGARRLLGVAQFRRIGVIETSIHWQLPRQGRSIALQPQRREIRQRDALR